jgi:hypothetical protein
VRKSPDSSPLSRIDVFLQPARARRGAESRPLRWPAKQRFDLIVRKRELNAEEAKDLRARLAGESPYRRAAARALRELTGRDVDARGDGSS